MAEKFEIIRDVTPLDLPGAEFIEATHLLSDHREFIVGKIDRVLDIKFWGEGGPPEVITFNGQRFVPEAE
jgi:hypothetical protein